MDGEDFRTLEAALSLIEEYDDNSTSCSGSEGGDPTPEVVDDEIYLVAAKQERSAAQDRLNSDIKEVARLKAKLAIPGRNRSRDLHRLELLELRVEAALLEQRVEALEKRGHKARSGTEAFRGLDNVSDDMFISDERLYGVWKNLAKTNKRLRRNAEMENRKLRELYVSQTKITSTMRKLFRRQSSLKEKLDFRGAVYM